MADKKEREALAAKFERHAEEEGKILTEYRALAESLGKGPAGFVIDMILTEEELHHLLLKTTAAWLREAPQASPALTSATVIADLVRRTQQLQRHEKETVDSCQSLRATVSGPDAEVIASVLDVMALDSEKHHRLLMTVEKMLKSLGA